MDRIKCVLVRRGILKREIKSQIRAESKNHKILHDRDEIQHCRDEKRLVIGSLILLEKIKVFSKKQINLNNVLFILWLFFLFSFELWGYSVKLIVLISVIFCGIEFQIIVFCMTFVFDEKHNQTLNNAMQVE